MSVAIVGPAALNGKNQGWEVLYRSTSSISMPESTVIATVLDSYTVPGGLLGLNSQIRVLGLARLTASGAISVRVSIDGVTNKLWEQVTGGFDTDGDTVLISTLVWNDNSLTSQRGLWGTVGAGNGPEYNVVSANPTRFTHSVDTTDSFDISVHCSTDAGEGGVIEWWSVEVLI